MRVNTPRGKTTQSAESQTGGKEASEPFQNPASGGVARSYVHTTWFIHAQGSSGGAAGGAVFFLLGKGNKR